MTMSSQPVDLRDYSTPKKIHSEEFITEYKADDEEQSPGRNSHLHQ